MQTFNSRLLDLFSTLIIQELSFKSPPECAEFRNSLHGSVSVETDLSKSGEFHGVIVKPQLQRCPITTTTTKKGTGKNQQSKSSTSCAQSLSLVTL